MDDLDKMIARAQKTGDVSELAEYLKGRPMSPGGFVRTRHGAFGDGEMDDRSWITVEVAVMDGELSEKNYDKLRAAVDR